MIVWGVMRFPESCPALESQTVGIEVRLPEYMDPDMRNAIAKNIAEKLGLECPCTEVISRSAL